MIKPHYNYRTANLADLNSIRDLGIKSYSEYSTILDQENWEKMNIFLQDLEGLKNLISGSRCFLCEDNNRLIGMVFFVSSKHQNELFKSEWSIIRFLAVDPEYRGKGLGGKLTDLCLQFAKEEGEKFIALHTSSYMNGADKLYEKKGFKKHKEIDYYAKEYWIYLLEI